MASVEKIWHELLAFGFDRDSLLINLGGGMITDLGGFAASVFKRGIPFIHIPTSLTAQVDAAIGGKTAINIGDVKNQAGTFAPAVRILIYPGFLETLPERELKSGFAEVVKHALIMDADYWEIVKDFSMDAGKADWLGLLRRSVEIKQLIVEKDPMEHGFRKILNFGHSIGHAFESCPGRHSILHGEAIAAGMICEAYLSVQKMGLPESRLEDIIRLLFVHFAKLEISAEDMDCMLKKIQHDKKNKNGKMMFSLLRSPGSCAFDCEISEDHILESIEFYNKLPRNVEAEGR
ncbi:MAG: 3-dehydroquinate synthase family protein [Bacteroidota bacterium]|nr:3-dehydroquinate synthase family protein [Bacteroidota bacterium]